MKEEIIIVIAEGETVRQSWASDASTFALCVGLIGLGLWVDSSAMQWLGAVFAFVATLARVGSKAKRLTVSEAKNRLDEIEQQLQQRANRANLSPRR